MIAKSEAQRLIRAALAEAKEEGFLASMRAATRLVDQIYGVDGADAVNPRYGTKHYQEHEAD